MPEPALHFSVIFALSAPILGVKKGLMLSLLTLTPDLDVFFHIHRSMSHSIVVLSLIWLPILLIMVYIFGRKQLNFGILCFLVVSTHLLMDCFQTYTPVLWPVVEDSLWIKVDGRLLISPEGFTPQSSISVKSIFTTFTPTGYIDAPLFTSDVFLISLLLVLVPLLLRVKGINKMECRVGTGKVDGIGDLPANVESKASVDPPEATLSKDKLTVVIPTLNEEESIGLVLDGLLAEGYRNILVVDGYSTDRTVEVARSRGVKVVYQRGVGKAGAITTALQMVSTPYMLVMDGDCTYDPRDIQRLLGYAQENDEVIGFRSNRENIPLLHRIGNRIIGLAFGLMLGRRIRDPCSGMYLLRTDVAKRLELTSGGFDIEIEIAGQIASLGRITEVPIRYHKRVGRGKLRAWRDGFRILTAAVKVMWLYNPLFMLSSIVALLAFPGVVILIWQLLLRYLYGSGAWSLGWVWAGLVLFIAGLQGVAIAVTSLMLKRMERRMLQALMEVRATNKD